MFINENEFDPILNKYFVNVKQKTALQFQVFNFCL